MMASDHAFHASVTCNVKEKKGGQKGQFSTSPFSPPINAPEHGAFQAAQNSSVFALSQRASLQPCMYIGDVLSLLTTFLCSVEASWPEAGQDSRTVPMVPQAADLGMKIISGYFSAKSCLQLSWVSFVVIVNCHRLNYRWWVGRLTGLTEVALRIL